MRNRRTGQEAACRDGQDGIDTGAVSGKVIYHMTKLRYQKAKYLLYCE